MSIKEINLFKFIFSLAFLYPLILVNAENYNAPIIQPGAPGNPSKVLGPEAVSYTHLTLPTILLV